MENPKAPLAGLKVIELARILAGPWIGQPQIAVLDTMVAMLANQNLSYLISGELPTRLDNAHPKPLPVMLRGS